MLQIENAKKFHQFRCSSVILDRKQKKTEYFKLKSQKLEIFLFSVWVRFNFTIKSGKQIRQFIIIQRKIHVWEEHKIIDHNIHFHSHTFEKTENISIQLKISITISFITDNLRDHIFPIFITSWHHLGKKYHDYFKLLMSFMWIGYYYCRLFILKWSEWKNSLLQPCFSAPRLTPPFHYKDKHISFCIWALYFCITLSEPPMCRLDCSYVFDLPI